jgi:hypothetical protein
MMMMMMMIIIIITITTIIQRRHSPPHIVGVINFRRIRGLEHVARMNKEEMLMLFSFEALGDDLRDMCSWNDVNIMPIVICGLQLHVL